MERIMELIKLLEVEKLDLSYDIRVNRDSISLAVRWFKFPAKSPKRVKSRHIEKPPTSATEQIPESPQCKPKHKSPSQITRDRNRRRKAWNRQRRASQKSKQSKDSTASCIVNTVPIPPAPDPENCDDEHKSDLNAVSVQEDCVPNPIHQDSGDIEVHQTQRSDIPTDLNPRLTPNASSSRPSTRAHQDTLLDSDDSDSRSYSELLAYLGTQCAFCEISDAEPNVNLKRCTQCQYLSYCSKDCQKKHWRAGHKDFCMVMAATIEYDSN